MVHIGSRLKVIKDIAIVELFMGRVWVRISSSKTKLICNTESLR